MSKRTTKTVRRTSTSVSDPLRIDSVKTRSGGRIGLTICPGKRDKSGVSAIWDRDLVTDVAAIRDWGAAAVVTLIEDHEFAMLRVPTLGAEVNAQGMAWLHLPIRDIDIPTDGWYTRWLYHRTYLLALLEVGHDVVVHCRGGRGRAGMVAVELLVDLGVNAEMALRRVRLARSGAVETDKQEDWCLRE